MTTDKETANTSKEELLRLRTKHFGPNVELFFPEDPIMSHRASGQFIFDDDGNRYLDCISNVSHIGHSHPAITRAVSQQLEKTNANCRFVHQNLILYAEKLTKTFPEGLEVCYFTNSGSEANDLALQMARAHTNRQHVVCLEQGYHGHVVSMMDVSGYKRKGGKIPVGFVAADWVQEAPVPDPLYGHFSHLPMEEATEEYLKIFSKIFENSIDSETGESNIAAFMCESIPSCAGQIMFPPGYLHQAFYIARKYGALCIVDEIQTGFGRVGEKFWAFELHDVVPDIVSLGKPMANGMPVGGVVTTHSIAQSLGRDGRIYFNTFGGTPVSMAAAMTVLNVIEEEKLQENALKVGDYLMKKLLDLKDRHWMISDVRGKGLFVGVELVRNKESKEPASEETSKLLKILKKNHVLLSSDGKFHNVLKFKPPLCFSYQDVDSVCLLLDRVEIATGNFPYRTWNSVFEQLTQVVSGPPPRLQDLPERDLTFSPNFHSFVSSCLCKARKERPKYNALLKSPFLRAAQKDEVTDMAGYMGEILENTRRVPLPESTAPAQPDTGNMPLF